jgi:hypothetical protein
VPTPTWGIFCLSIQVEDLGESYLIKVVTSANTPQTVEVFYVLGDEQELLAKGETTEGVFSVVIEGHRPTKGRLFAKVAGFSSDRCQLNLATWQRGGGTGASPLPFLAVGALVLVGLAVVLFSWRVRR